ncbi:unnamed protein product [Bursaphelenchus xylophilus]|uniref:Lysophospholipid acyltransferase 7 n=1 Tax=Bursaphelenchus xylophilus TaxID=6326 RepID=A0A1I7RZI5_BURXY|nr:unnamed protein product [Bursaphelenchus xylophilus]CAG9111260.1 unnamed protein product [Bursaphelenchus xylophilus]
MSWHLTIYSFYDNIKGDLKYAGLLIFCTLLSLVLRRFATAEFRVRFDGIIGLLINIYVSGWTVLYSLLCVAAHLVLYQLVKDPRHMAKISFFGTFTYLGFLRIIHWFGLPKLEFITNAIQLIMTLRVVGLSYEISDSRLKLVDDLKKVEDPSPFQAFNYLYSYTGLFTGPYYTYRTYVDAYDQRFHAQSPHVLDLVKGRLTTLSWSLPILILMNIIAPVQILKTEESGDYNIIVLFILSALLFVYLRMRIYSAWMVAESICIISGIGVYDHSYHSKPGLGPTKMPEIGETAHGFDANTVDNLDIPHVENSDGFRSGMRAWNRTVQFWLAHFVYKRAPRSIRLPWTMFVSAFWHGVHPGYFLSFLTIPLCTAAEDVMFKRFPVEDGKRNEIFDRVWRFIRMRGFEMMACGFLLLTWTDTIRLWKNQFFYLHVIMIGILIFDKVHPRKHPEKHHEGHKHHEHHDKKVE